MISKVLKEVLHSNLGPVIIVLGSSAEMIQKQVSHESVQVVINTNWEEGMSSSIKMGIKAAIESDASIEGIVIAVCDQPFITASLIKNLVSEHESTGAPIVASTYKNTKGTPAYFHASIFDELLAITGDAGAKKIVEKDAGRVSTIPFPQGHIDIDTIDDYNNVQGIL